MRAELLESYTRNDTVTAAHRMLREAIDMSVEEPDYRNWQLLGGGGGGPVIGGTLSKDLLPQNAAEVRRQAYFLYYHSPYVRGIIRTLTKFVFGKGVKTEFQEKNKGKLKKLNDYYEEWCDVNGWDLTQKESSNRSFRDGETFWHNRAMGNKKIPRLEYIEPDDVASKDDKITHGIELDKKDPTRVLKYHIIKGDAPETTVAGDQVVHIKLNVDRNVKRGRSILEPVFRHLKLHDEWLNSRIVLNKVRSALVLVRHVEGTQQQGQMVRSSFQKSSTDPNKKNQAQPFKSGTVLTAGPGVKYEMLSANLGASDAAQDGRNILLAIAVGIGFPEMFLTGNFENANYSSTLVAQNPFVREFEDWQDFFDFHIQREIKIVIRMGIEAGLVAKDTSDKMTNKFPPLTYEDFVQMSVALGQLYQNEILSGHTYCSKLGLDYEEEQELREKEGLGMPGTGGFGGGATDEFGNPLPAPSDQGAGGGAAQNL